MASINLLGLNISMLALVLTSASATSAQPAPEPTAPVAPAEPAPAPAPLGEPAPAPAPVAPAPAAAPAPAPAPVAPAAYPPPAYPQPPAFAGEAVDPTVHNHDGFYLRLGIGVGYGRATRKGSYLGIDIDASYSGVGPAYELLIGGTPAAGFVVGGGFVGQDISDPKVELTLSSGGSTLDEEDFEADGALGIVVLGPFVDWYPDPQGGFHAGAMVGLGGIGLEESESGLGGALSVGYDIFFANQWSFGITARAVAVKTSAKIDDDKLDDTASSFELLGSVLLH